MRKLLISTVALVALAAAPAFAEGGGNSASAGAGALAGASASTGESNSLGSASVGGAYCSDGFVLGPIGAHKSRRACEIAQTATAMFDRGALTLGEYRAAGLVSLEQSGVTFKKPAPAAMPNITGDWASLSRAHQKAVKECKALWNGKKVVGCSY